MVYRELPAESYTTIAAATDTGRSAKYNEDTFLTVDLCGKTSTGPDPLSERFLSQNRFVLGVFDGTGASSAGGLRASRVAAETIGHMLRHIPPAVSESELTMRIVSAFEIAGEEVMYVTYRDEGTTDSVTTATVAVVTPTAIELGHVGDSRAYMLRGEQLVQMTRDHSLVNQYLQKGRFTVDEVERLENSRYITQALGTRHRVRPFTAPIELRRHDTLLLCTRGLSSVVKRSQIASVLLDYPEPSDACRVLLEAANDQGGFENITVVVARFDGNWLALPAPNDILADEDVLQRAREARSLRPGYRARQALGALYRALKPWNGTDTPSRRS